MDFLPVSGAESNVTRNWALKHGHTLVVTHLLLIKQHTACQSFSFAQYKLQW